MPLLHTGKLLFYAQNARNRTPVKPLPARSGDRGGRTARCLIADDQPLMRDALARHLAAQGGIDVVAVADNGESLAELAAQVAPDVAVLEIALGGRPTIELCRAIAERVRVVFYTSQRRPGALEDALDAGARGFVLKTSPAGEIAAAVRTVADGGSYVDPRMAAALVGRGGGAQRLTGRERQVLELLADGATTQRVADVLFLSTSTVRSYVELVIRKLEARNRTHAVAQALRDGLIE